MKRIVVVVVVQMSMGAAALGACSSTEPSAPSAEAGTDAAVERTTDATAVDVAIGCVPQALHGAPRYVPARPWHQDVCTKAQPAGSVRSCFSCIGTTNMSGIEYLTNLSSRWCMAKPDDSDGGDAGGD